MSSGVPFAVSLVGEAVIAAINDMAARRAHETTAKVLYYGYEFPITITAPEALIANYGQPAQP